MASNNYAVLLDETAAQTILICWTGVVAVLPSCNIVPHRQEQTFCVFTDDGKQQCDITCSRWSNCPPLDYVENSERAYTLAQLRAAVESADIVQGVDYGNGHAGLMLQHGREYSFVVQKPSCVSQL